MRERFARADHAPGSPAPQIRPLAEVAADFAALAGPLRAVLEAAQEALADPTRPVAREALAAVCALDIFPEDEGTDVLMAELWEIAQALALAAPGGTGGPRRPRTPRPGLRVLDGGGQRSAPARPALTLKAGGAR